MRRDAWRAAVLPAACVAGLALVPRVLSTGWFQTADEPLWIERSVDFSDAVLRLDPAAASASTGTLVTMPGVTTMWLGAVARAMWALGVRWAGIDGAGPFATSPIGWQLGQLAVAVTSSVLIGVFVVLAWRWASPVAATVAGALLASEPFIVAHSAVLHTDILTALFGAAGVLALLLALGIPKPPTDHPRLLAALGGALLGAGFLSKISAMALLPGLAVVIGVPMFRSARRERQRIHGSLVALRRQAALCALACGVALAIILLAWPAIWADPIRQLGLLWWSANKARTPHLTFFLGEITDTPGLLFYAVAAPMRMTPWFLLGSVIMIPIALARRRQPTVLLLTLTLSVAVIISVSAKQFDRYALPALPFVALALGLGVDALFDRPGRTRRDGMLITAGVAVAALLTLHAISVAPLCIAYFNPLLGGSKMAERAILVGWGEGLELAGQRIREREAPQCNVKVALKYWHVQSSFPCGTTVPDEDPADYRVLYVNERQRLRTDELRALRQRARLVDVVTLAGLDYVEIYDQRQPPTPGQSP